VKHPVAIKPLNARRIVRVRIVILSQRIRAYAITSLLLPPIRSAPATGVHCTALTLLVSVQITIFVSP
jgi:hypothetical protein